MFNIISIDGGGVYSVISVTILSRLLEKFPNLIKNTNLFSGTSAGGLVCLLLADGYPPSVVETLFKKLGLEIFLPEVARQALFTVGIKSKYSNRKLRKILEGYFGVRTLSGLQGKVLISAFKLRDSKTNTWKAKFFHNLEGQNDDKAAIVDVALATSAVPVLLPISDGYVDGALVSNNPALCAVVQTQDGRVKLNPRPSLSEIKVLSLGKVRTNTLLGTDKPEWGYLNWALPIIKIIMDKDEKTVDYQCDKILGDNYCRIAPKIDIDISMDDFTQIDKLVDFGKTIDLSKYFEWFSNW